MHRWIAVSALFLVIAASGGAVPGDNWPGWRGDGSGVAREQTALPMTWGPEQNVLWKTPIEGDGISSPVIWEDRVIITAAVEGANVGSSRFVVAILLIVLVASALGAAVLLLLKSRSAPTAAGMPSWLRLAFRIDRVVAGLAAVLFAAGVFKLVQRLFFEADPFSYAPQWGWLASGKLALLGVVAALGAVHPRSTWRLIGTVLCVAAAAYYHHAAPYHKGFSTPLPVRDLGLVSGPLVVAAAWYLILYVALFRQPRAGRGGAGLGFLRAIVRVSLAAATIASFFTMNFLKAEAGLWRTVVCLDRDSGEVLWTKPAIHAPAERKYSTNSHATPTPATNGTHVISYFGHALVGMDYDGNVLWRTMVPKYMEYLRYGSNSSPVIFGDRVIYTYMAEIGERQRKRGEDWDSISTHSYVAALDIETGEEIWKVRPPDASAHDSYGTPFVVSGGERPVVLVTTYHHGIAYDAETGEQLWIVKIPLEQPVPSFIAEGGTAYLTGGIHGPSAAAAIRLGGRGDVTESHVHWKITRGVNDVSSPVLYEGLLYWVKENGIIYCVDAATGEVVWRDRLQGGVKYHGSLVAGDGKVYIPSLDGDITVIEAGREFKLLARNSIGENSGASPAISAGRIFIRGENHLFCIGSPAAP